MATTRIIVGHVLLVALVLLILPDGPSAARVVVFTFLLEILVTVLCVSWLSRRGERLPRWLRSILTRQPDDDAPPFGLTDAKTGMRVGLGSHLLVLFGIGFLVAPLLHAAGNQEVEFEWPILSRELAQAAMLCGLYLVHVLTDGGFLFRTGAEETINLAYHARPFTIIAFVVLASIPAMMIADSRSPWVIAGLLILFRHVAELIHRLRGDATAKRRSTRPVTH